jgi:hypothetical protein
MATKKKVARKRIGVAVTLPKSAPVRIHIHRTPTCSGDHHDPSCPRTKQMISCSQVTIRGVKVAVCVHKR